MNEQYIEPLSRRALTAGTIRRSDGRASIRALALVTALVAIAAALGVPAWRHLRESPPPPEAPLRLAFAAPSDVALGGGPDYPFGLASAPDGRRVAFPAVRAGAHELWFTDLTTGGSQVLPGTAGGVLPFWSPDGRELAFFAGGKLRAFRFEDGQVRDLADAPSPRGGVWHPTGAILFAPHADRGLLRRDPDGTIHVWSSVDAPRGESSHRLPTLLHDGRTVVFFVAASEAVQQGVWVAPFDDAAARQRLIGGDAHAIGAGDHLLFASDAALVAQRVEPETRVLTGQAQVLGSPVGRGPHHQLFATAAGEVLLFGPPASTLRELRWVDRTGSPQDTLGEPMDAWDVRIAPRGASVAVTRLDPQLRTLDIWTYETTRLLPRRISPAIDADESPVWSPDATQLAWISGRRTLQTRGAAAELAEQPLRTFDRPVRVTAWSPDRQWLVVTASRAGTNDDLLLVPASGEGEPRVYAQSPFNETQGTISPDGQWIAYASDESGRLDVYVDSVPTPGRRARVTTAGGADPRWSGDGRAIYFRRGSEIHQAVIDVSATVPAAVSSERLFDALRDVRAYDVAPDGRRFLLNVPADGGAAPPIAALIHWRTMLVEAAGENTPSR